LGILGTCKDAQASPRAALHGSGMNEKPTVLVTGANKGLGYETARRLAELGMSVLVGARDADRGKHAVSRLCERGADAHFVELDLTDEAASSAAARDVARRFGRLDVLVNNAGIGGGQLPSQQDLGAMRALFETNVYGTIAVTQAFLPLLERSPAARIVNVSTTLASLRLATDPTHRITQWNALFAYVASKAALNAFTVRLAHELRPKRIKVNAACPGYVATDFNQHRGVRTVEQGAEIIVRLATLLEDGPTAGFFDDAGAVAW
jgi:NAD(P)-dependent dehydrogenase (short-subunit alcohol dehydrogenase family)